jgi:multimeric flavodoxin WrbA
MKVVAFNGSPRRDGNTAVLLGAVLRELESQGIETELVHLKPLFPGAQRACGVTRTRMAAAHRIVI